MGKGFIRASQGNVRQGEDMACRSLLEALKDVPDRQGQGAGAGVPADAAGQRETGSGNPADAIRYLGTRLTVAINFLASLF